MIAGHDADWWRGWRRGADGLVSLGVLASSVPRDVVDDAVAAAGRDTRRAGGKLPPHVMVYFVMALALFADDDYEEVAARLTETLQGVGLLGRVDWEVPTRGGITQARQRPGSRNPTTTAPGTDGPATIRLANKPEAA